MSGHEFSGFDVDAVTEAVSQPSLDELRSNARSRRHRSVATVTTALVALAALAVVPLLAEPDRAAPADPPTPSGAQFSQLTLTGPDSGVDVRQDGCVVRFAYTGDGGRSWSDWDAARFEGTRCTAGTAAGTPGSGTDFFVLGERSYLVTDSGLAHISTDYGRTWQDAASAIVAVPTFPATARPVLCGFRCAPVSEPLAVDPSSGTVYRLTARAPSWRPLFSLYPAADGSIWATYRMGSTQGSTVARSADRGATWTTWEVGDDRDVIAAVGIDDQEGYVLTAPTAGGGVRLLRTTDGAKTWTDTGAELSDQIPYDLTVGSDGSLLAITAGGGTEPDRRARLLVSRDDGRHFTVAREYGRLVGSVSVAPGYVWLFGRDDGSTGEPDHVLVTTDATTWTRFSLAP
ncbi:WD40/YVTN/BNR-like repeat-containing protein [Micromonospora sp. NPDC007208]|uniref:WD40/YVTN/BNR-like repeat-containing protein n=1 Tax=Micromonospora sp. NPDC007208 TaxID=3364236 RepID=UPI0036BA4AD6